MARAKKDGIARTFYLKKDIAEAMDRYSEQTGIPKTTVVEKAIEEYIRVRDVNNNIPLPDIDTKQ